MPPPFLPSPDSGPQNFPTDYGEITGKQSVREQLNVEFHNSFTAQTGPGNSLVQEFNTRRN